VMPIPSQQRFSPDYFFDNFNTPLDPQEEEKFQQWVIDESNRRRRDYSENLNTYDLRGDWQAGAARSANDHGSDYWKKPNHETFSDESMYHHTPSPLGIPFRGGRWGVDKRGGDTYTPSDFMLQYTEPREDLEDYMRRNEKDVKLLMPKKRGPR